MQNCYQRNHYDMPYNSMRGGGASGGSTPDCACYLAIASVPWQYFTNSYEPERAFCTGTMFPELDKPFSGRSVKS